MHRAALADESRAKLLQHSIRRTKNAPKPLDILRIVSSVLLVLIERYRIRYLNRHLPDVDFQSELRERRHCLPVKRGDGFRLERDHCAGAITALDRELVVDEVKLHFEERFPVRHRGGCEPTS